MYPASLTSSPRPAGGREVAVDSRIVEDAEPCTEVRRRFLNLIKELDVRIELVLKISKRYLGLSLEGSS